MTKGTKADGPPDSRPTTGESDDLLSLMGSRDTSAESDPTGKATCNAPGNDCGSHPLPEQQSSKTTVKTSEAKTKANRENAKKSTGPKAPAGKQKSSMNAYKHGAYAISACLFFEKPREYAEVRARVYEHWHPLGLKEEFLAEQIVGAMWRLKRIEKAESDHLTGEKARKLRSCLNNSHPDDVMMFFAFCPRSVEDAVTPYTSGTVGDARVQATADISQKRIADTLSSVGRIGEEFTSEASWKTFERFDMKRRGKQREIMNLIAALEDAQAERKTISLPVIEASLPNRTKKGS